MALNFTIDVVSAFITAIISIYGFVVSVNQLRNGFKYLFYWFIASGWLLFAIGFALEGVTILFLSATACRIFLIFAMTGSFMTLMVADSLKRERVEPLKLTGFFVLYVLSIILGYIIPDAYSFGPDPFGGEGLSLNPLFGLFAVVTTLIPWIYFCHCTYLVNKRAPAAQKHYSRMFFAGTFCVVAALLSELSMSMILYFILVSVAAILTSYSFSREPKLLFILPFTALRLAVLDTEAGLSLFTHTWNQQETIVNENLFSGVLHGINGILKDFLKQGEVQDIQLSNAIIIAYRIPKYPVAFIIVATRPSRSLRDGLKSFANRFCNEFHESFEIPNDVDQFSRAEELVTEYFPHIPIYD